MRRINHLPGTVEAVATRHGTIVGPIQTDLTGYEELTPYRGGWCGNDIFPEVFDLKTRKRIRKMAQRLGKRLYAEGYKGAFCMDFLLDTDDGSVYLGEINPRISGASPLTNLITSTLRRRPALPLPPARVHRRRLEAGPQGDPEPVGRLRPVEPAGPQADHRRGGADHRGAVVRAVADGRRRRRCASSRQEIDWHAVSRDNEAFYLRVYGAGEYRYPGADVGVVVTRGRMQTDDRELLDRGRLWAEGPGQGLPRGAPRVGRRAPGAAALDQVVLVAHFSRRRSGAL